MAELLSALLRVRISSSQQQCLSEAAALAGITPSEYARRLISNAMSLQTEISALRHTIETLLNNQTVQLESILLLRQLVFTEQVTKVHSEMRMLGYLPIDLETT